MDQDTESTELLCLIALRDAREWFQKEIVLRAHAHDGSKAKRELTEEDYGFLRGNEVFQIAEFYFLLKQFKLADPQKIRQFLGRHNDDMRALASNKEKLNALGFTASRPLEGIFSSSQIEKVAQQISDGKLRLDQSDLGRLLCSLMSVETTRKSLLALSRGGWIIRLDIGHMLIVSTGALETCYEKHLNQIVSCLKPALQGG